jgi:hypothetical protein
MVSLGSAIASGSWLTKSRGSYFAPIFRLFCCTVMQVNLCTLSMLTLHRLPMLDTRPS